MQSEFLEVRHSQSRGRGLYAKKDVSADTVILQVEASQFITYSMFAEHPFLASLLNKTEHKIVEFAYFAAFIYYQHQLQSSTCPFYQYLQRTPTLYHNLVAWTHQQLQELGNADLLAKIKKKQERIKDAFIHIHKLAMEEWHRYRLLSQQRINQGYNSKRGSRHFITRPSPQRQQNPINYAQVIKRITLSEIIKYISIVQSRNAYFPNEYDSVSEVGALVPHLDLFNHSAQSKCKVELTDRTYKVIIVEKINRGEEVCVDYGPFSREDFLQFYGMIPEDVGRGSQDGVDGVQSSGQARDEIELADKYRKELCRRYRESFRSEPIIEQTKPSNVVGEVN